MFVNSSASFLIRVGNLGGSTAERTFHLYHLIPGRWCFIIFSGHSINYVKSHQSPKWGASCVKKRPIIDTIVSKSGIWSVEEGEIVKW